MFTVIFSRNAHTRPAHYVDATVALRELTAFGQSDVAGSWGNEQVLMAQALTWNTAESRNEKTPYRCPRTGQVICSWVRLDNRKALADLLDIPAHELNSLTDPEIILHAYQHWGSGCFERLEGNFSIVIYDPLKHCCYLARDSLGIKPLYYYLDNNVLIASTSAAIFHHASRLKLQPDQAWMSRYLLGMSMSYTDTPYRQILKLAPAHSLIVSMEQADIRQYFRFQDTAPAIYKRDIRWVDDYRARLESAMRCHMRSAYGLGSENSGGIDSATVTAYMALLSGVPAEKLHTFSVSIHALEPEYISEVNLHSGIRQNHILKGAPSVDEATLGRSLKALGYPMEQMDAMTQVPFYRICQETGVRTLFSGFGGDEVVTNPAHHLPVELLDARQYRVLFNEMPGSKLTRSLRFAKFIRNHRKPSAYNSRFLKAFQSRWPYALLRTDVAQAYDLESKYLARAAFDAPYRSVNQYILQNRLAPYVSTRLENCTLMAALYKTDYRWPLLDRRLIQQYLATPSIEKWHAGMGRYLHRRAAEGVVPAKILWKASKDMGLPGGSANGLPSPEPSIEKAITVQAAPHAAIQDLIDPAKLQFQIQFANTRPDNIAFTHMFFRQIRALWQLNAWLKLYHP